MVIASWTCEFVPHMYPSIVYIFRTRTPTGSRVHPRQTGAVLHRLGYVVDEHSFVAQLTVLRDVAMMTFEVCFRSNNM